MRYQFLENLLKKHLHYFGYASDGLTTIYLPSTIAKLYHLQVLGFDDWGHLVFCSGEEAASLSIHHFGSLTSLQTIPIIEVEDKAGYEKELEEGH
uniref:Uncharacterized protein n=1 Tax=Oryza sativa subsp. indica TaxID=39946 RepID=A0A679B8X2_ORYSI|nr:hypothetical protein [Oryza sativa Indica Group]